MYLQLTPRELAFRDEVRAFLSSSVPQDISDKLLNDRRLSKEDIVRWQQILNARGWAVPHWPIGWGGTNWTAVERYIFREEMQAFPAPPPLDFAVDMIGPLLIAHGSDDQKRKFLPRIANLDDWWCQGFSEPGAGSDLAALKTAARRDGNEYVLNGQKIWTTMAHYADWMFCLVRTAHGEKKQSGISLLVVNMKSEGITVRPIITMEGDHEVNEVFFDDVRVPAANLVGEQDRGWDYAKVLLSNERATIARVGVSKARIRRIKELAASEYCMGRPMIEDRRFREKLASVEVELKALEMTQLRLVADEESDSRTGASDATASLLKIKGAEIQQATTELLVELAGLFAMPFVDDERQELVGDGWNGPFVTPEWAARAAPTYFHWRKMSIYGGSDEIQRNVLARGLFGR